MVPFLGHPIHVHKRIYGISYERVRYEVPVYNSILGQCNANNESESGV